MATVSSSGLCGCAPGLFTFTQSLQSKEGNLSSAWPRGCEVGRMDDCS